MTRRFDIVRGLMICWFAAVPISLIGCDDEPDEPSDRVVDQPPGSGDESPDGEFDGVVCRGATDEETAIGDDPQQIYGRVVAPEGRLASGFSVPGISEAHADSPGEVRPVAGIEVMLTEVDMRAEPLDEALGATTTDDDGRWCLHIPEETVPQPGLMVVARGDDHRLRRPLVETGRLDIEPRTEALVRLLVDEGHRFDELDAATVLEFDARAVELVEEVALGPRPDAGIESWVARLVELMANDASMMETSRRVFERRDSDQ